MTLETRLRDNLEAQRDAVPGRTDTITTVIRDGRRRLIWRRTGAAIAGVAALALVTVGTTVVLRSAPAVAASPLTGVELAIINESPVVLRGELGPEPETFPTGVDLTFTPIDKPTADDLDVLDQVIRQESYESPVVVALGEIAAFDTRVYLIHDIDPETRSGNSSVVAIGPDYPSFTSHHGPTNQGTWGLTSSRGLDGDGHVVMRVPDLASYVQVEVNGSVSWQRPSDGFFWIPFNADPDQPVTVTGHDPTGRVFLNSTIPALPNRKTP